MNCPKCSRQCYPIENPDGTPQGIGFECENCRIDFCVDEDKHGKLKLFIKGWNEDEQT